MLSTALLSFALLLQAAALPSSNHTVNGPSGNATAINPKIIGGVEVEPFKYPWLASIQYLGIHVCGGVLLDYETVITAAHCSAFKVSPFLRVQGHRHNLLKPRWTEQGLKFKVKSIHVQPNYEIIGLGFSNDIAVWKVQLMRRRGQDELPSIGSVALDDGTYSKENNMLEIAGWGKSCGFEQNTNLAERAGHTLFATRVANASVKVVADKFCGSSFNGSVTNELCTFASGQVICGADAGGPLFAQSPEGQVVLVGIASSSNGYYSVGRYSKIANHAEWIKKEMSPEQRL